MSRPLELCLGVSESFAFPGASEGAAASVSLDGQLDLDLRPATSVVEVAPVAATHRVLPLPAQIHASEGCLDALGNAGLAGAVATHDQVHAGPGAQLEPGARSDAAEPGDGD